MFLDRKTSMTFLLAYQVSMLTTMETCPSQRTRSPALASWFLIGTEEFLGFRQDRWKTKMWMGTGINSCRLGTQMALKEPLVLWDALAGTSRMSSIH